MENEECGKCGVCKMRSVENEECEKMRSVENVECGKCGVWKMRSVEIASIFHFNFSFPCGKTVWNNWNVNKLIKKCDASLHFLDAQFVLTPLCTLMS